MTEDASLILDLTLPAAGASLVWRHPALAERGRPRAAAESWVWLDTPGGWLYGRGQALRAPPRGPRLLLPLQPLPGFRLPGEPCGPESPLAPGAEPDPPEGTGTETAARYSGRVQYAPPDATGVALRVRIGRIEAGAADLAVAQLTLSGPRGAVLGLAAALAADLPVMPAASGLDEMALALARSARPALRRRGPPDLGASRTPGEALALAIAHLAEVLLGQAPLAQPDGGPDAVHQLRVAARRLRSCLKLFRPTHDGPRLRTLDAGLRDLARGLGNAREWDVFLGGLGAELSAALGPDRRWARLLRQAEAQRLAAYDSLRQMLDGPEFRGLIWTALNLAAHRDWTEAPEAASAALRPWAAGVLQKRRRKLKKGAVGIEAASDTALHELRLKAKRLRYAAELFAPLWPGKGTRRYLKTLSALQDALGLSNDAVVARERVASLGGRHGAPAWAIGLAEGWALAAAGDMRPRAIEAWHDFARRTPFWHADRPAKAEPAGEAEAKPPAVDTVEA